MRRRGGKRALAGGRCGIFHNRLYARRNKAIRVEFDYFKGAQMALKQLPVLRILSSQRLLVIEKPVL